MGNQICTFVSHHHLFVSESKLNCKECDTVPNLIINLHNLSAIHLVIIQSNVVCKDAERGINVGIQVRMYVGIACLKDILSEFYINFDK